MVRAYPRTFKKSEEGDIEFQMSCNYEEYGLYPLSPNSTYYTDLRVSGATDGSLFTVLKLLGVYRD